MDIEQLKFPIGKYEPNKNPDKATISKWISEIENFPSQLDEITKDLSVEKLNYKYRPEGWTVKQVIHHCADSHMNSYIRFKLALTEETPAIRPYFEDRWAELDDSLNNDISTSISLLKATHKKWVEVLKNLSETDLQKEFMHPEHGTIFNLAETIGNYAWHGNHHLAHVKNGIASNGSYS